MEYMASSSDASTKPALRIPPPRLHLKEGLYLLDPLDQAYQNLIDHRRRFAARLATRQRAVFYHWLLSLGAVLCVLLALALPAYLHLH